MTKTVTQAVQARAARVAGAMYLLSLVTAVVGQFFVQATLVVRGDAVRTAQNIVEHERLFRAGIVSDLVAFGAIVPLALALYVLLRPVNEHLALLAAFWRLVEAAILCVATIGSLVALALLSGADYLLPFETGELHALAQLLLYGRDVGYNVGLVAFGLGSTVFSYLLLRSGYVPRALAGWGVIASLFVTVSILCVIVVPGIPTSIQFAGPGAIFFYEIVLGAWLLFRGATFR